MSHPRPTNIEISFPDGEFIVSKTNISGRITYGNELFIKLSGYTEKELLGSPHSILRHPDMPKAVFKLLWETIQKGDELFSFVKNMAKNGDHYWVKTHVTPSYNDSNKVINYHSVRRRPKREAIRVIEPIYTEMLKIEKTSGIEASYSYLEGLLRQRGVSYDEFIFAL
ncbi:MAG TPA: PAS domain-containing protein [Campylobacterales bacterium]|nr:PAS domain-containing protein [Campylobacterales bacterium]